MSTDIERLLKQRYYINDSETWAELSWRVSAYICEKNSPLQRQVYKDILEKVWLPNSPCLVNAGKPKNPGLLACYVAGPGEDDLSIHIDTLKDIAQVAKFGGGCGFSATHVRPKNKPVAGSTHGYSYGPINYALKVSDYMDMMTQSGFRSMALMFTMRSDHEDLDEFIDMKQNENETIGYNFNQSIMVKDEWMEKAIYDPDSKEATQFEKIVVNAWSNGEPGMLFYTTINKNTPYDEPIETSNPCGEQLLPEYGACCLGSINITHDRFYDKYDNFKFYELENVVDTATEFLDLTGTKTAFPNEKFQDWYGNNRPIGIGIMGYADALLRQGVKYGFIEALSFLENVMETIQNTAKIKSHELGKELGFPQNSKDRRNITVVSIAPTGSIAFIAGCSHGIEPVFSPIYNRTDERGESYIFKHNLRNEDYFVSAINDYQDRTVSWKEHLDTQLSAQKFCDSGVSKTINFPSYATVEEVKNAFVYAWQNGAKGLTVYRDQSRQKQVLETLTEEDAKKQSCPSGVCDL